MTKKKIKKQETVTLKHHEDEIQEFREMLAHKGARHEKDLQDIFEKRVRDGLIQNLLNLHNRITTENEEDLAWCLRTGYTHEELPSRIAIAIEMLKMLEGIVERLIGFPHGRIKVKK